MSLLRKALESRVAQEGILDMFSHYKDAEVDIDRSVCSEKLIEQLRAYPHHIAALDAWILSPDRSLLPKLRELGTIVKEIYKGVGMYRAPFKAYRGFDMKDSVQDAMGLVVKKLFFNRIKEFNVGDMIEYKSEAFLLSFSTMRSIARAFGDTVIEITVDPVHDDFLFITDELCVLVGEARHHTEFKSQKEVILFPPFHLSFKVIEKLGHLH